MSNHEIKQNNKNITDSTPTHSYILTFKGEKFTPLNPDPMQIHIEDIAHALSLMCRANGHIDYFFSVAQHSMNCAIEAKARGYSAHMQLACLIHDASEAYISDITRPVKQYLLDYKLIERRLQDTIYKRFLGTVLNEEESELVQAVDNDMLMCELNALMRTNKVFNKVPKLFSNASFKYKSHADAEKDFLRVYYGIMHAGLIQGK